MIELIDHLMAIITLMALATFLLATCPVWIIPYIAYTIWWRK